MFENLQKKNTTQHSGLHYNTKTKRKKINYIFVPSLFPRHWCCFSFAISALRKSLFFAYFNLIAIRPYSINQKAKKTEFGKEKFLVSFQINVCAAPQQQFFFSAIHISFSSPPHLQHSHLDSLCPVCAFFYCCCCCAHGATTISILFFCTRRELLNRIFSCYRIAVERLKNMNKKNLTFSFFDDFCFCIHIKRE